MNLNVLNFSIIELQESQLPFPFTSNVMSLCGMHSLFKDYVFLTDYFLLMVEFCNRSWVGRRLQQAEGMPGGCGVEKPSEARCTTLMWANGNHKDLTAFWHVIGCWTCGFLSGPLLWDLKFSDSGEHFVPKRIRSNFHVIFLFLTHFLTSSGTSYSLRPHVQPWGSHLMALCKL